MNSTPASPRRRPYRDPVMAQELSWDLADAACKHLTIWWTARERAHATTPDPRLRGQVLHEITQVCSTCRHLAACALRAETDGYTGLAAANAYLNGRSTHAGTIGSARSDHQRDAS